MEKTMHKKEWDEFGLRDNEKNGQANVLSNVFNI